MTQPISPRTANHLQYIESLKEEANAANVQANAANTAAELAQYIATVNPSEGNIRAAKSSMMNFAVTVGILEETTQQLGEAMRIAGNLFTKDS